MILTGKAKEYFLKQYGNEEWEIDDIYLHALIIEFFDSVGIYIEPNQKWDFSGWLSIVRNKSTNDVIYLNKSMKDGYIPFLLKSEAAIEAIKKANEIYNAN